MWIHRLTNRLEPLGDEEDHRTYKPADQRNDEHRKHVSKDVRPVSSATSTEELRCGIDVICSGKDAQRDSESNQQMGKSIVDQDQAVEVFVASKAGSVHGDGAVDKTDQKHKIDTDPTGLCDRDSGKRQDHANDEDGRNKDQDPTLKSNVF